jgi:hypothetical protein
MRSRMSLVKASTPAEFNAQVIDNSAPTKDAWGGIFAERDREWIEK